MRMIPLISSLTVQGIPDLISRELGRKTLARANLAAGIDLEALEGQNFLFRKLQFCR
nr:hypothetical protein [Marinicella sp. W31]MDC2878748.1 hypothetical protein [Marinicella sp. W31]